jgi:hypothetical protein
MATWLDLARDLPLGHKTRVKCTQCGTDDKSLIVNHSSKAYNAYCFRCGDNPFEMKGELTLQELSKIKELNEDAIKQRLPISLPEDYTTTIPLAGRLWLYSGGITESVWKKYAIGYSETLRRVILPVFDTKGKLIWYQCRAVLRGQTPKYIQPSEDRSSILFFSTRDTNNKMVVIVEDILSAIRVGEATGLPTCSLLGTKITTAQANTLSEYEKVCTWLDSDKAGVTGAYNVRKAVGLLTETKNVVTEKDPKCYSNKEIKEVLCKQN